MHDPISYDHISNMSNFLTEGESAVKVFAYVSFDDFKRKKGYDVPIKEAECKGKILLTKIRSMGIKKALKEIGRPGILCKGMS